MGIDVFLGTAKMECGWPLDTPMIWVCEGSFKDKRQERLPMTDPLPLSAYITVFLVDPGPCFTYLTHTSTEQLYPAPGPRQPHTNLQYPGEAKRGPWSWHSIPGPEATAAGIFIEVAKHGVHGRKCLLGFGFGDLVSDRNEDRCWAGHRSCSSYHSAAVSTDIRLM